MTDSPDLEKDHFIRLRVGFANDPKHRQAMGEAVWLYLHLHAESLFSKGNLDRKYQTLADILGLPLRTLQRQMKKLEDAGYIELTRRAHSLSITITNWEKRTATHGVSHPENSASGPPLMAHHTDGEPPPMADQADGDPPLVTQSSATHGTSPYREVLKRVFKENKPKEEEDTTTTPPVPDKIREQEIDRCGREADRFIRGARLLHRLSRGVPLTVSSPSVAQASAELVAEGFEPRILRAAFLLFLRDDTDWLAGKEARTVPMFRPRIDDYSAPARRMLEGRAIRRRRESPESRAGPAESSPRAEHLTPLNGAVEALWKRVLAVLEKEMLPENFETWIAPIFPGTYQDKVLGLVAPNEYSRKCLTENYTGAVGVALKQVAAAEVVDFKFIVNGSE